ncbi:hypothetical protein H2201_006714 [Coniosporium apollinis]|uniref:Uncharacterized protein n=1 Tax=Coniosporium apollinis TaxID=61459 RepID=A0ABQ9NLF9_9PEZI|nr:hypothetical protein H2201_006714 [Coniosporium apollinis]
MLSPTVVNIYSFFYPIARNILLFTLIVDDVDGSNTTSIWDIYYHFYLETKSLKLLQLQSKKLCALSTSLHSWHSSEYGRLLRFCDQSTFIKVKEIWSSYAATTDLGEDEQARYDKQFVSVIQKAVDTRVDRLGKSGIVLTGFRSTAPVGPQSLKDLPGLHQQYWDHGTTDGGDGRKATCSNPMFASSVTDTFILHYGTDPLLGFHLASAYVPLAPTSPLRPNSIEIRHLHKVVAAARLQFQTWAASFRNCAPQSLTLRFFAGDALAFCHTLQHKRTTNNITANPYRTPYCMEPLALNGDTPADAPVSFDVIDTSNLVDHIGAINVLVATAPLLKHSISASLHTESLVRREKSYKERVDSILCGHFSTISFLLGLFPVEYWTNVAAVSTVDENLFDKTGQMHMRLTWKRLVPVTKKPLTWPPVHLDESALAHILYRIYLKMFESENLSVLMSGMNQLALQKHSLSHYHRGSLAIFISLIKTRVAVNWNTVMTKFLGLVESDLNLMVGMNYIQELILQLHLLGVHSIEILRRPSSLGSETQRPKGLRAWKDIPAAVCVTLKVPRAKLAVFTRIPRLELGVPTVQCVLQSSPRSVGPPWQNLFASVQLAFGKATTSGVRNSDSFRVQVTEDESGWSGSSPLFLSFYAPTWTVLQEPESAIVAFGIQSTPFSSKTFSKLLGHTMNVYEASLGDEDAVYVTKHMPNQSGYAFISASGDADAQNHETSNQAATTTITANVDLRETRIGSFIGRVNILSEDVKSVLRSQGHIETVQISACVFAVTIGKTALRQCIHFPVPVLQSGSKTWIARKSGYVEVIAPMAAPMDGDLLPYFMYPMFLDEQTPVVWNLPRLKLECLPVLDPARLKEQSWLTAHTSFMFSSRERELRDRSMMSPATYHEDVRVHFKDSVFSMFINFSGLQGNQARIFCLNNPTRSGGHMIIFVSSLRLDGANRTVILDAAVLPLTLSLVSQMGQFLAALPDVGHCNIKVDDNELRLWKQSSRVPLQVDWMENFDLVIIGAGIHGLSVAKTYKDVNPSHSIVILDRSSSLGGTWAAERLFTTLKTNDHYGTFEFSDLPMKGGAGHIPGPVVHSYLCAYAEKFDLARLVRLSTEVNVVEDRGAVGWKLTVVDVTEPAKKSEIRASKLVVATGLTSEPFMPELKGRDDFGTPVLHSSEFAKQTDGLGPYKKVVIMSGAKFSWDIAYAYASAGVKVDWVIRASGHGPCWMAPSRVTPLKVITQYLLLTRFFSWFSPCIWGNADGYWLCRWFLHKTWLGRKIVDGFFAAMTHGVLSKLGYDNHPDTSKLKPWDGVFFVGTNRGLVNYDQDIFEFVRNGTITVHIADITHLSKGTVHLSDNTKVQTDVLICGTGWKETPPVKFLTKKDLGLPSFSTTVASSLTTRADAEILSSFPKLALQPPYRPNLKPMGFTKATTINEPYRLYRFMVPPSFISERTLAFAGAIRSPATMMIAQTQALWITAFFGGHIANLEASLAEDVRERIAYQTVLHSQWGKWRYSRGFGGRFPDIWFDSIPYIDLLLSELGVRHHRKGSWWREFSEHYSPADYKGIVEEWKSLQPREK